VQGSMDFVSLFGEKLRSLALHKHQFEPYEIYNHDSLDNFIRGMASQPTQDMDSSFSRQLTQHLFQGNDTAGMDLVALNLQRGRDHGLAPYVKWRKLCGLPALNSWKEVAMNANFPHLVPRLQQLYGRVDKLDLYIGGLIEKKESGSMLGATFQCIISDQFKRLKIGDKFWYENAPDKNPAGALTQGQVNAIRESSLARVLCDNGDSIQLMQPLAFKKVSEMNAKVGCTNGEAIPRVPLDAWKESIEEQV